MRSNLKNKKRIVVKVGTSTITHSSGKSNLRKIEKIARVFADIRNKGIDIVLVTSGAIAIGASNLHFNGCPDTIGEKQAAAAVGQCELMYLYIKMFSEYNCTVGQILLTRDVVENEISKRNVINTFENMLSNGIIPIVNENDSVSVEEIEFGHSKVFGDNDTLSAIVATLVNADLLVLLSDIEGFYKGDPKKDPNCSKIDIITEINEDIEKWAGGTSNGKAKGGMKTKLEAGKKANKAGIDMVIANGENIDILYDILEGKDRGTYFKA